MTYSVNRSGNQSSQSVPQVMPDPLYCLPTDNLTLVCFEATENGRIFFGTQEGSLLELDYGPIPGWNGDCVHPLPNGRTGPCTLVNHSTSALSILLPSLLTSGFRSIDPIHQLACDPVRHLMYSRTEDSNLTVYDYAGKTGAVSMRSPFSRLAHLSGADLAYSASSVVRSVDKSQFRSIVSIIPLSSGFCHLMAVTKTGIRLYFGEHLRLLHIRLPPASPYGRGGLGEVKLVAETRGTVVFISTLPPDVSPNSFTRAASSSLGALQPTPIGSLPGGPVDSFAQATDENLSIFGTKPHVMHTMSPDPYPWTPNLTEVSHSAWCVNGVWALTVLPCRDQQLDVVDDLSGRPISTSGKTSDLTCRLRGEPPVVLTQHLDPAYRRLLLISAQGLVHFRLPSPLVRLKNYLTREISSRSLNNCITADGLLDSYVGSPLRLLAPQVDASTGEATGPNALFLSSFLHQFSPDEAICAALVIGASQSDWNGASPSGVDLGVEQAVLYFAAQAAQFWIPAVKRPNLDTNLGYRPLRSSQYLTPATSHPQSVDKTLSSGLFLFNGLCMFLARMGRTFWRSPLFRDAGALFTDQQNPGSHESRGLRSWMHTFVSVLASASPLRTARTATETKLPIISRLDSGEIIWLIQQISFLQKFLRRQLDVRGGWLRATVTSPTKFGGDTPGGGDRSAHVDMVLLQRLAEDLDKLLSNILEILSFWCVLSEHAIHKVVERMTNEQRNLLLQVPFETYALSLSDSSYISDPSIAWKDRTSPTATTAQLGTASRGLELISALINALIDYYLIESEQDLDSGINLDGITARLQAACPTLFANEDAMTAKASECLIQANLLRSTLVSEHGISRTELSLSEPVSQDLLSQVDKLVTQALELYHEAGPAIDLDSTVQRLESVGSWRGAVALCLAVASKRDPNNIAVECLKTGRRPSSEPLHPGGKVGRLNRRQAFAHSELAATEGRYDAYHQLVRCIEHLWELTHLPPSNVDLLNQTSASSKLDGTGARDLGAQAPSSGVHMAELNLTPSSARSLLMTILRDIIQSDDILAHFEVLGWLLAHRLTDTAIGLNSPHLEAYLRSRLRQTPDDPDLRSLLWCTLERRGARLEAAQVLEHLAVTPCRQLTLDARLDFLSRAIVSVKALPAGQQNLDYLHDLESRLELAQLQQQLHVELSHLSSPTSPTSLRMRSPRGPTDGDLSDALYRLSHGPLLSLSDMFTDYADKFGLHESKLALLWTGDSDDEALITAIWRDLLRHVLYHGNKDTSFQVTSSSPRGTVSEAGRQNSAESSRRLTEIALVDCLSRLWSRFAPDNRVSSTKSQLFFPLLEIVSTLEYHAIRQRLPTDWVPTVLRDARLTCSASALDAYDSLLHSKDKLWRHSEVRDRLFVAFVTVIEDFLSTVSVQLPMRQRMLQTGRILDCVISNLVDLNANPLKADEETSKGVRAPSVIDRLRQVHDQLQRFYR
ncbi:unnamed protein product [Dicrocoelium dendriticum]|nr:unnamed protein product [Dicrocoelium dendriticum]